MEVELMVTKSDDDDQPTDIRVNIEQSASGWLEGRVSQKYQKIPKVAKCYQNMPKVDKNDQYMPKGAKR